MATAGGKKKSTIKTGGSSSDFYIPPIPVAVARPRQSLGEDMMGWVAAVVLVGLLLPLGAMLYMDNLTVNKRTEKNLDRTEKLQRQIEELKREIEQKEKNADRP